VTVVHHIVTGRSIERQRLFLRSRLKDPRQMKLMLKSVFRMFASKRRNRGLPCRAVGTNADKSDWGGGRTIEFDLHIRSPPQFFLPMR